MNETCKNLINVFQNPHTDYGPVVMWFWNDYITKDGITFQLEKFREENITEFFIHPAVGFAVEYLSDHYMELIQFVVQEAKRLGMHYWIYDEYEYPSGTAGGILCRDYPQYRQKELYVEDRRVAPGDRVTFGRPGKFLGATIVLEHDDRNEVIDVSGKCRVTIHGDYTEVSYWYEESALIGRVLFFFSEVNMSLLPSGLLRSHCDCIPGYVDMMNYEAVGKYIELTHERYKQFIGDEFGKTVRGVFTDEPTTLRHFDYTVDGPWSDNFDDEFRKDHGYSMIPWLYLVWDIAPKSEAEIKAIRDYRHTVKRLYLTNFCQQYSNWCTENNLLFTGHYGGEEVIKGHIEQGDMLEALMPMHVPGMDTVSSANTIGHKKFNIAPKFPSSAAKFNGANRVLAETFTISGWQTRFTDMKRVVNRLMLLGVNWIQYMGASYNIGSTHKNLPYGCAPCHGYQNTLFPFYHKLGDYIASFSALSAHTVPDASVLMFLPLQQAVQERYEIQKGKFGDDGLMDMLPNACLLDTVNALIAEQIGFDLYSEGMTDGISVFDGYVEIKGYRYDTVLFPRMKFVNSQTKALIEQLKAHHVKTVFLYELPGVETDNGKRFDAGYRMQPCNPALNLSRDGNAYLINPTEGPIDINMHRCALQTVIGRKYLNICADEGVFLTKRTCDDADVYFLCNDNAEAADAIFDALPGMRILDANTRAEASYTVKNGRVSLTLDGLEMLAIVCGKEGELPVTTAAAATEQKTVKLAGPYDFTTADGNCLPLDYEMYDPESGLWDPCRFTYFSDRRHVQPVSPYHIRSRVQIDHLPESVVLNAEITRVTAIKINGAALPFCRNIRRWSSADYTVEIGHLLHPGENIIEVEGTTNPIPLIDRPPYLYLAGDFGVSADKHLVQPSHKLAAGGWEQAGYPYFCGTGIYKTSFTAEEGFRKAVLTVNTKDIATIFVNGKPAGEKLWVADKTDITDLLHSGENTIEVRITSTRANMFAAEWYPHAPYLSMTRTENGVLKPMEILYER